MLCMFIAVGVSYCIAAGLNPLDDSAACRLSAQEDVQEELTDRMAEMATQLRSQAEAQSSALHARDAALDSASQKLLKSVHGVTTVVAGTKTAVKRTRRSMFFFMFLLLGVAAVFLGAHSPCCDARVTPVEQRCTLHLHSLWARQLANSA